MNNKNLYNAIIKRWWLKINDDDNKLQLGLEIRSTAGTAILRVPLSDLPKLFNILSITNIEQLKGSPCLALVAGHAIRTIGNFMFQSSEDIYSDEVKVHLHDENYWLDYNIYLKYKDD